MPKSLILEPTNQPVRDYEHPVIQKLNAIPQPEQRTEAWYAARKGKLTASDINTALGENPYKSRLQLVLEKAGMPSEFKGNVATEHGQKYEPVACEKYEKEYGRKVYEYGLLPHPTINFLAGSPDGVTNEGELIEIKCPYSRKIKPEVPSYYYGQIQLGLQICELEKCHFIQYRPEPEEFIVIEVLKDNTWWEKNYPKLEAFKRDVDEWTKKGWRNHPQAGKFFASDSIPALPTEDFIVDDLTYQN